MKIVQFCGKSVGHQVNCPRVALDAHSNLPGQELAEMSLLSTFSQEGGAIQARLPTGLVALSHFLHRNIPQAPRSPGTVTVPRQLS